MGLFYRRGDRPAEDALDLDETTAQHLLHGLTPDDAPPGYAGVAAVLAAAAAPATSEELAGEDDACATFVATSAAAAQAAPARPFRVAAALVAALVVLGGTAVVAGATGNLPGPAQDSLDDVLDGVGITGAGGEGAPAGSPDTEERGPDPVGPAGQGLCTAYGASQDADKLDSTAFRALVAIVGADAIAEFCAAVEPGNPAAPGQAGTPPGQGGTPPGQVDNPGQGGTPPGQGGTPPGQVDNPGQGGTPPGQVDNPGQGSTPPGQGGTPPGQGGTPPGQGNGNGNSGGNGQGDGNGGIGNGGGQTLGVPDPVGGLLDGLGVALGAS